MSFRYFSNKSITAEVSMQYTLTVETQYGISCTQKMPAYIYIKPYLQLFTTDREYTKHTVPDIRCWGIGGSREIKKRFVHLFPIKTFSFLLSAFILKVDR